MAKTPEGKVKDSVKADCKSLVIPVTMPMGGSFGKDGVSDFILNWEGRMLCIETKAGVPQPTQMQLGYLKEQWEAGAVVGCIGTKVIQNHTTSSNVNPGKKPSAWLAHKPFDTLFQLTSGLQYGGMSIICVEHQQHAHAKGVLNTLLGTYTLITKAK